MPRTKIPKNSKRNREVANREEKVRLYELKMDSNLMSIDNLEIAFLTEVDNKVKSVLSVIQTELRDMKMSEILHLFGELNRFGEFKASEQTQMIVSMSASTNTTGGQGGALASGGSRNDEEDSSLGASGGIMLAVSTASMLRSAKAMRTPGPLHSARARRARRSRSACGELSVIHSAKAPSVPSSSTNANRMSRGKMRTPMSARPKAFSADRTPLKLHKARTSSPSTPPMAFLRYPKPGEVALSKFGSPMVAQVMPEKFANVNIPIRNGILSLRPKKLEAGEVESNLLDNLDESTLNQIKTLHANLQMIVNKASQAGFK
ncbi:borealin isoform X2 [Drosophila miranda]|uniref:borealin isoform X2 n=1 Tax=Drosophila miranda TaxID=7229 RepID=UPI0007E82749|nr:borealin isoform X2 [Drosophila miranda]